MRKWQKQEALNFINSLYQAHEEIKEALNRKRIISAQNMLSECQEFAISFGENIKKLENRTCVTVARVEEYCEELFHIYEELGNNRTDAGRIYEDLNKKLLKIEDSVRNDIRVRKEIVFFPYKASMWDSLESIYMAAKADSDCDVYCVPIPYFELRADRSVGKLHYEGHDYPKDVEVIDWQTYHFEERKPDVIYIHNPYDEWNLVTRVLPRYYSSNLKKYTETLVYVPYYATAGDMSESQRLCPAYIYADYIVIQAPRYRDFFDESIPDRKFLPFGSPKFDRIVEKCGKPPMPPAEWRDKMRGKRVYFYNTSINGMLADTEAFLKKMEYVFTCFQGRKDACLLWRPHPLLESSFDSMRAGYKPVYEMLKNYFIQNNLGIYDTTSVIEDTIALSDVYIGDGGTSVIPLFGIAGKPVFLLNNRIHSAPKENDWRGEAGLTYNPLGQDRWAIIQGNKLYCADPGTHDYRYRCDLSPYSMKWYYSTVFEIEEKLYVCPGNAQDILVTGRQGIEKRIQLEKRVERKGAFCGAWKYDKYLLLLPRKYPAVVRYDTAADEITYLDKNIDVFIKEVQGETRLGGSCLCGNILYIGSPVDNRIYSLEIETGRTEVTELPIAGRCGFSVIAECEGELWLLPYEGEVIVRWSPVTGRIREYTDFPDGFKCVNPVRKYECRERPFNIPAFHGNDLYLPPNWANMYVKLNVETGEMTRWQPPFKEKERAGTGYFFATSKSTFLRTGNVRTKMKYRLYSIADRSLYDIDPEKNTAEEIGIHFDLEELKQHEPGFCEGSDWMRYMCQENAFNSLTDLLDGNITGYQFDKERQLACYREIAANYNENCGQKTHDFIRRL